MSSTSLPETLVPDNFALFFRARLFAVFVVGFAFGADAEDDDAAAGCCSCGEDDDVAAFMCEDDDAAASCCSGGEDGGAAAGCCSDDGGSVSEPSQPSSSHSDSPSSSTVIVDAPSEYSSPSWGFWFSYH